MQKLYALALIFSCLLNAQDSILGPGGVSGSVLWMKTVPTVKDLRAGYRWQDFSGDSLKLKYYNTTNTGNEYIANRWDFVRGYSFNPALRLTSSTLSKELEIESSNLSTATVIGVFGESAGSGERFSQSEYIMALNGTKGKGFVLDKDKIINSTDSKRGVLDYGKEGKEEGKGEGYDLMYHSGKSPETTLDQFKERTLRSFVYYRTNKPNTSVWGEKQKSVISLGQKFNPNSVNNTSTYDTGLFNPNGLFDGYIPELIIYNRLLTPIERIKTESYLAMKYGFTLESSYISSSGQLLWNTEKNEYSHRITAIFRDDLSGVYQRAGTTAYEKAPYFSYTSDGDSYNYRDSYNLSNRYKLLVMERFPANTIEDEKYMIWGDNAEDVQTRETEEYLGMKIMNRKWSINTNMGGSTTVDEMKWNISSNLTVEKEKYKLTAKKAASTEETPGIVSSAVPLPGYDGHISFTLSEPLGHTIVKFGTPNVPEQKNSNDYGIYISTEGKVFPIIRGYPQWGQDKEWAITVKGGDRIRINKTKESIIISSNGNASPQKGHSMPQIFIESQDIDKDFHVTLGLYKWTGESVIKDIRAGGFIDTGNRIELSYADQRASGFSDYKDGKAYIMVDRSGTGAFKEQDTDLYPSDEYDPYRQKITFNNVFFNTDADPEGKDVFTFGYRESNIIASIEKENPKCDNGTGLPLSNGKIKIKILRGDPGFEYQLYNQDSLKVIKKGSFFDKEFEADGLPAGKYTLKLKEMGGFNLLPESNTTETRAASHLSIDWDRGGFLETTLKSTTQNYQMGLIPEGTTGSTVQYGFEIREGRVYLIDNYNVATNFIGNIVLKPGDKLQIHSYPEGSYTYNAYYRVNGVDFHKKTGISKFRFFRIFLKNMEGAYHIRNADKNNWYKPLNWNYKDTYSNPKSTNFSETTMEHAITLESSCSRIKSLQKQLIAPLDIAENNFKVYYKDSSNQSNITARLNLKAASPISLVVFNLSGVQVYTKSIMESRKEHILDLEGLPKGVYVLKVFTSEGEFTKKIIIN